MIYNLRLKMTAAAAITLFAVLALVTQPTAATSAPQESRLSDANIAAIVSVAGELDIAYGKIALSKSRNKQIKEFAERMVADHSAVQKAAGELLTKLGVKPVENDTSRGLAEGGVKVKEQLNKLKGKDFDKFYIDNEISYHEVVVNAVEKLLIPNAQNAELKSTLASVLPLFQKHLEHARQVQASFGMKGDHKMGANH